MTVVRDEKGEGHAVLTARTVQGDFILDNKVDEVKSWNRTRYEYIMRQSYLNTDDLDVAGPARGQLDVADRRRAQRRASRNRPGSTRRSSSHISSRSSSRIAIWNW